MKESKKVISALAAVAMSVTVAAVPVWAYNYENEAGALNKLGLYKGINESYFDPDLGANLDRQTGVVMLLRMFGQEDEAKSLTTERANSILSKFRDASSIADWSKKQVAFAVERGYVKGYSDDSTFRPSNPLNGKAYCSLILQQLGYNGDFQYDRAATKLSEVGGLTNSQANTFNSDAPINKDSLVGISYGTLKAKYKSNSEQLVNALVNKGRISKQKVREVGLEKLEITSVASIQDVTVTIGSTPNLPSTVKATFEDGTKGDVNVTWDRVDTSRTGEQSITGKIADSKVTARVKVIVVSDNSNVNAVSSGNLKEILVKFSNPVKDEDEAKDKANYRVDNSTIKNASLSEDKKTVTLLLNNTLKQQADVKVTVDKAVGLDGNVKLTVDNVKDVTTPSIVEVTSVGNAFVKVTFSEPLQGANSASNFTIDGRLFGATKTTLSNDEKTVSFKLSKGLSSGSHTLAVKKLTDYANFSIEENEAKFSVVEDKQAPTASIKDATQTKVVINFSEEVEEIKAENIVTSTSSKVDRVEFGDDNKTLTIYYRVDNALPVSGGRITINGVSDFCGNKVDIKLTVDPEYDVTRPDYFTYTIEDQIEIILEFSEEVYNTGKFKLTNEKNRTIDISNAGYAKDKEGKDVKTKLVLKRSGGIAFDAGKYKLSISGVTDYNPLKNEIEPITVDINIDDKTPPVVTSVYVNRTDNQVFVKFNKEVDENSATTYTNYYFTYNNISRKLDKSTMDIDLLSDDKTVCITFPYDEHDYDKDQIVLVNNISRIQVEGVKDLKGNEMVVKSLEVKEFNTNNNNAPTITSAVVTEKSKIVVTIKGSIDNNSLQPNDFYITTARDSMGNFTVIEAYDAAYDSDKNEITLNVNADIDADGTFDDRMLYLALQKAEDVDTVNTFGQKLTLSAPIKVSENFDPAANKIASSSFERGVGTVIYVELSENLRLNEGEALNDANLRQFRVKADGITVPVKIYYYNAVSRDNSSTEADETHARFKIVIGGDYSDDRVQVIFYADPTPTITDTSGNGLIDFDLSDTVN